jgi:hypothetical protein
MRADTLINAASVKTDVYRGDAAVERKKFALDGDVNAYLSFSGATPLSGSADIQAAVDAIPVDRRRSRLRQELRVRRLAYSARTVRDYLTAGASRPATIFTRGSPACSHTATSHTDCWDIWWRRFRACCPDYMLKRVFAPLGMSHSRILLAEWTRNPMLRLHVCK